jgi:hypothetical protein
LALQRPIITSPIAPFDATQNHTFAFYASSGDQVVSNEIEIYNIATGVLVYTGRKYTFQLQHIISTILTNGIQYKIRVRTYNVANVYSEWSDYALFWCLKNATLAILGMEGGIINNHTYTFDGSYVQDNNENLQSYQFILYDYGDNIISYSPKLFDGMLRYEFTGFQNNTSYKIEFKTISAHGLENTTGLIPFTANFIQPKILSVLNLTNLPNLGSVKVDAEIIQVCGQLIDGEEVYIDNEYIDLTSAVISYQRGFSIADDFTMKLFAKFDNPSLQSNDLLALFKSTEGYIEVRYQYNRIHVYRYCGGIVGHWANNASLNLSSNDTLCIQIQQENGLMDVKAQIALV